MFPNENISHITTPNAQTSLADENLNNVRDSGAIHLQGKGVCKILIAH